eukprot:TRINITY_DN82476_c2_g1_i2.p1 TRINITY_DN82476_c2_g1~~TRINITY_DN82476_c2_g1_i2.p1  ORF type:complete len:109 (+),score=13.95 TRINITY_DN82476_c2_g1_i2:69-395(+)
MNQPTPKALTRTHRRCECGEETDAEVTMRAGHGGPQCVTLRPFMSCSHGDLNVCFFSTFTPAVSPCQSLGCRLVHGDSLDGRGDGLLSGGTLTQSGSSTQQLVLTVRG